MSYLPLNEYARKWIFTHQSMPVSDDDLAQIKPLSPQRSAQVWTQMISQQSPDSARFASSDWPAKHKTWQQKSRWQGDWESDEMALPIEVDAWINWQDDVTVYFCYDKYNIIETKWLVFKNNWKNFLFFDDGPILIGRRRQEALWFHDNGEVQLGMRES